MIGLRNTIMGVTLFFSLISLGTTAESSNVLWGAVSYGGGGRFTAIAADPSNPGTIYIGSDVAGIFRSRDGGNQFDIIGHGLGSFAVADICVNPFDSRQVFVLTDAGLYHSVNQGDSWTRLSEAIRYPSRFFGSRLLLITQKSLWIAADESGMFQIPLTDLMSLPKHVQGPERAKINAIAVYDGYLYAGTSRGVHRLEQQQWKSQNEGFPQKSIDIMDIAVSGSSFYVVEKRGGLFCWNTTAHIWEKRPVSGLSQPKSYKSLAVHPGNPDMLFIGTHPETWPHLIYKSRDGGKTWKSIQSFQTDPDAPFNWTNTLSAIERILFVPGTADTVLLTDWWNVWQSSNAGENWTQKHSGLQNTVINDLKIHPRNPKMLYLCTADNGLMISEDSGKHWRRAMSGVADGHAQEVEISRSDPARMVLLMNPWGKKGKIFVYESRDAGVTWHDIGFSVPVETLPPLNYVDGLATNVELHPVSDNIMYVGTNGYGVYKTTNNGKNWTSMNQGLITPYIKGSGALRVHPQNPETLFASTQAGGIYKSTNGARDWQRVTKGDMFTFGIAIDTTNPSRIMAGCAGNTILISHDEGKSWRETHLPVQPSSQTAVYCVGFHPRHSGWILAGTIRYDVLAGDGLFVSRDDARSFEPVPMNLPKVNINSITLSEEHPAVGYVGFSGTGLFRVEIGEKR